MCISELESLNHTKSFIHRAADWKVIDGNLTQPSLVINNKQTPVLANRRVLINSISFQS